MRTAALLLLAGLGAACSASRGAAPEAPKAAAAPAPAAAKSWQEQIAEIAARAYAMPAPPMAYMYHTSDAPEHLAENVSNAAQFIAQSLGYQKAALTVPSDRWTDKDRSRFEENKVQVEKARRVLREDSAGLLR